MTSPTRNFPSRVPTPGVRSPLSSANASAGLNALAARTEYLNEALQSITSRSLIVHDTQPISPDLLEAQAVFWDATESRYSQAVAGTTGTDGDFGTAPAAECLGLLLQKRDAAFGTIALRGVAWFTASQLANLVDGDPVAGRYYLSSTIPGKITRQKPAAVVPVAHILGPGNTCEDGAWVVIMPQARDFPNEHIHYRFELTAAPAGTHTPPLEGEPHVVTDPDASLPGWLPAAHASFDGEAPAGAAFGYNLAAHPALHSLWPPLPAGAALLELVKPLAGELALAGRVPVDYVRIDARGIWWMTDCYDHVPWPTALNTTSSESSSSASSVGGTCPTDAFRLTFFFLKTTFTTEQTAVTSLAVGADQPIRLVDCNGRDANVGDLTIHVDVSLAVDEPDALGGNALKGLSGDGFKFQAGWLTEGVIAGSSRVILSGSRQRYLTPGNSSTPRVHQGIVTIDIDADPADRELSPEVVRLGDANDREYVGISYLGFPEGRESGVRMRFNLPYAGLPTSALMTIRGLLFGLADGPWCALNLSYYRIPRPVAGTPTPLASGDTALTFDVVTPSSNYDGAGGDLPGAQAIEIDSDTFVVEAGDTIFVELRREDTATPIFAAEIGVIRLVGLITSGA